MKKQLLSFIFLISSAVINAQSLHFDGTDDYVSTNINCDNTVMPEMTWEAWVKPTNPSSPTWQMVIASEDGGYDRFLSIYGSMFRIGIGNGTYAAASVSWNQWQHIAVVFAGDQVKFYKNSVEYVYAGVVDTASQNSMAAPLWLGSASYGPYPFGGNLDNVRVWNVARTSAEIQNNMYCAIPGSQSGLVANYNCTQGTPNSDNTDIPNLNDSSGNANDGTLNNFMLNGSTSNFVDNVNTNIASVSALANPGTIPAVGTLINFIATPLNAGPSPSYQWKLNGVNIPGATSQTYSSNSITPSDIVSCALVPDNSIPCIPNTPVNSNNVSVKFGSYIPEILYYNFDGSGTTVPNLASNPPAGTNTANAMGGLTQGGNLCNGALVGTGVASSTDYLNTHWTPNVGTSSWSVSFWSSGYNMTNTTYYAFGVVFQPGFRCFTNGVAGANNWMLRGPGITDIILFGGATNAPTMNTFVYDSITQTIYAYLNGDLVNTVIQNTPLNLTDNTLFKVMGYGSSSLGSPVGGKIDEFRFYRHALSAGDVLHLYNPYSNNDFLGEDLLVCQDVSTPIEIIDYTVGDVLWSTGETTPEIDVPQDATYSVSITGTCGHGTDAITVTSFTDTPIADFSQTADELEIDFTDNSVGISKTWLWDFGDGSFSSEQNPSHSYATPGEYSVCLTTATPCGFDTECRDLVVDDFALPIELMAFNATALNRTVLTEWKTATEINNDFFNLERSINGTDWEVVGRIDGAGNSSTLLNYNFVDEDPYIGLSYYRLKQTDFDGNYSYSNIRTVNVEGENELEIYPNPSNGSFTIRSTKNESFDLINELGQIVFGIELNSANKNEMTFSNFQAGVYFLVDSDKLIAKKIVVLK